MYARSPDNVTRQVLARLLHLIVPAPCLACGERVPEPRDSLGLCPACRRRLVPWPSPGCAICGRPLGDAGLPADYRCGGCRRRPPPYDGLLSAWSYQPPIDSVLTGLKFRRLEYLGSHLGRALVRRFGPRLAADLVVPVPLHWWRRLRRGYNQADAIARPLAAELGLPCRGALRRRRPTPAQSRLSRAERQRNLAGAFVARRSAFTLRQGVHCAGRRILLVDDVTTTGATLRTATECLLAAGARSVTAVTAARTPDEPLKPTLRA